MNASIRVMVVLMAALFSTAILASGSGGYGGDTRFKNTPRQTDPVYEHGKAIFKGRSANYKKVKFCLKDDEKAEGFKKIKSRNIKPFKETSYEEISQHIVICDNPEQLARQLLSREDILALIYYLDKRYRLKLS